MSAPSTVRRTPTEKTIRECVRPFRQLSRKFSDDKKHLSVAADSPVDQLGIGGFHPKDCTVEAEGIELLKTLVRQSYSYPGPIVEIGTLLGVTTTQMAIVKRPEQRIIAVDNFCWNPWGLTPDVHHALAEQCLHYLIETGDVELLREDKNEFFANYERPTPAMVFLDAMHDYEETKKDILWAKRVGAKIISGHDYCDKFPGVIRIVEEFGGPRRLAGTVWTL
jgi:hypothetical protein